MEENKQPLWLPRYRNVSLDFEYRQLRVVTSLTRPEYLIGCDWIFVFGDYQRATRPIEPKSKAAVLTPKALNALTMVEKVMLLPLSIFDI